MFPGSTGYDSQDDMSEKISMKLIHYENLSKKLLIEVEDHKKSLRDNQSKLLDNLRLLDEHKQSLKRKIMKIKSLRKERDGLKIEILKLKQIFSEKCDGYKDIK
jgi:hypothetical protein